MAHVRLVLATSVAALLLSQPAVAHVYLTTPTRGERIQAGSEVLVQWQVAVNHGPPDTYDLMYSLNGANYVGLASDLSSSVFEYAWTAPDYPVENARMVVVQHGANGYEFMDIVPFVVDGQEATPDAGMGDASTPDAGVADSGADTTPDATTGLPDAMTAVDAASGRVPTNGSEILALLERRCSFAGCHGGSQPQAGLDLAASAFSAHLASSGLLGVCEPENSVLLARLRGEQGLLRMPPRPEQPLPAETIQAIQAWIEGGAVVDGEPLDLVCGTPGPDAGTDMSAPSPDTAVGERDLGSTPPRESDEGGCSSLRNRPSGASLLLLTLLGLVWRRRKLSGTPSAMLARAAFGQKTAREFRHGLWTRVRSRLRCRRQRPEPSCRSEHRCRNR